MRYWAGALGGLVMLGWAGCGEEPADATGPGDVVPAIQSADADPTDAPIAADWWPPMVSDAEASFTVVLSVQHLAQSELEATLHRWLEQVEFEQDQPEFQRGFVEGLWSPLFDEVGFRQFILQDHGVGYVAGSSSVTDLNLIETVDFRVLLRTTQADTHDLAYEGIELLDAKDDVTGMRRLNASWLELEMSGPDAIAEPAARPNGSSPSSTVTSDISTRLPADMSVYLVTGPTANLLIFPERDLGLLSAAMRSAFEAYEEATAREAGTGVAIRFGPSPRFHLAKAFVDEDSAVEYVEAVTHLVEAALDAMAERPEPPPVEAVAFWVLAEAVQQISRDGRYVSYELSPEQLDEIAGSLGRDLLPGIPLVLAQGLEGE